MRPFSEPLEPLQGDRLMAEARLGRDRRRVVVDGGQRRQRPGERGRACGVGGGTAQQDEGCARAGVEAVQP